MKTAISIPDKVFRSADSLAKRLGVSRSQLYATAITEFLLRHQSRKVTERLDHIYEEEDSSLAHGFLTAEIKSLSSEEW
jgi:metal-responsive CopG/Arc/MetJ family transcriptional regulator